MLSPVNTPGLKKLYTLSLFIAGVLIISALLSSAIMPVHSSLLRSDDRVEYNSGWTYFEGDTARSVTTFPFILPEEKGILIMKNTLPVFSDEDRVLFFRNQYQKITVAADSEVIFFNGDDEYYSLGNFGCLVVIPAQYSGKEITVSIESPPEYRSLGIQEFLLGTDVEVLSTILYQNQSLIFFLILSFMLAVSLFLTYIYFKFKHPFEGNQLFLYVGLFVFFNSVWLFTDSVLPQFIFSNILFVILLSFYTFMLQAVPFLSIVRYTCGKSYSVVIVMQILLLGNAAIQTVLFLLGYLSLTQMLPLTNLIVAVTLVFLLGKLLIESIMTNSFYVKRIMLAEVFLVIMSLIALVRFYMFNDDGYSDYVRYGLITFMIVLVWLSIRKAWENIQAQAKIQVYRSMAYLDPMTHMGSRAAFDLRMKNLSEEMASYTRLTMIICDINNLKEVNDSFGHDAGDAIIAGVAACILQTSEKSEDCYRIGGDEFALIIPNEIISSDEYRSKIQMAMNRYNNTHPGERPLSMAVGLSTMDIPFPPGFKPSDLFRMADQEMYLAKRHMKSA